MAANCRFAEYVCSKCNKKGHLARMCHSQKSAGRSEMTLGAGAQAHQLTSADPGLEEEQPLYNLEQQKKLFPTAQLQPSKVILRTYVHSTVWA